MKFGETQCSADTSPHLQVPHPPSPYIRNSFSSLSMDPLSLFLWFCFIRSFKHSLKRVECAEFTILGPVVSPQTCFAWLDDQGPPAGHPLWVCYSPHHLCALALGPLTPAQAGLAPMGIHEWNPQTRPSQSQIVRRI